MTEPKKEKESLWQQIALKLKGITRSFKEREFSYQNTIHHLRTENTRLLDIHQDHCPTPPADRASLESTDLLPKDELRHKNNELLLKLVRA